MLDFVRFNMEQYAFTNFVHGLTAKLRNVACLVMNTLRGESFLKKNRQPLVHKEDGGCKTWLEDIQQYFKVVDYVKC